MVEVATKEEYVLPFPGPKAKIADVSQFRGTWITSSVRALKNRGFFDAYIAHVAEEDRDRILYCTAGSWVPVDLVVRHYAACDALALPTETLLELGMEVTERVHGSSVALGRSLASASGVTPWTILGRLDKLWTRAVLGGGVAVAKTGPKDGRVEIVGFPVSRFRYNRLATRGIIRGLIGLFCTSAWVHEVPAMCTATTLGFRVQWA
jgi:hypothetical protein